MWYVIPEVTYCVFVFIGPVFLTVLLVSSRHGWYHRSDHACVTWINSSRDISFLLVQILARDHGSLGLSVWSIDAIISSIFSSFPTHPPWRYTKVYWVMFSQATLFVSHWSMWCCALCCIIPFTGGRGSIYHRWCLLIDQLAPGKNRFRFTCLWL